MILSIPKISKLIFESNGNEVWQCFGAECVLSNIQFVSDDPFVFESDGINYLVVTNVEDTNIANFEYVLLSFRKPKQKDVKVNRINFKRWLKHPTFVDATTEQGVFIQLCHAVGEGSFQAARTRGLKAPKFFKVSAGASLQN